jgi:hypothetical protein
MGIKEALGFGSNKIRYAIVGVGDIAQEDMMPGVEHTYNSIMTALVTSDSQKAQKLGAKYDIQATFTYEEFPQAPPEFSTQFMWRCRTGGMPNLSSLLCARRHSRAVREAHGDFDNEMSGNSGCR